jgi:hypothetical protein
MSSPGFLGAADRQASAGFGLVHVESGALLASLVHLRGPEQYGWRSLLRRGTVPSADEALVASPARWAHTFFGRAPVDVAFVDRDGTVLKLCRGMPPFRAALSLRAHAVVTGAPGMFAGVGVQLGDRVALTEEQTDQWAGETEDGAAPEAGTDSDPWDVGTHDGAARERVAAPEVASKTPDSEPNKPAAHSLPPRAAFSRGVDLARLLERAMPLSWFEAVAIVQELCAVLLSTRRPAGETDLEPEDVAITHEGNVEVRAGAAQGVPPVARVAHLLLALLGEARTLPVQLRLLALQEVSPTPTGTTLRDWSARLATFERPGRQRTIREVYERFMQLPIASAGAPVKEPAPTKPARVKAPPWWRSRRVRNVAASVALLVAAGLAAAWLWRVVAPILSGGELQKPEAGAGAGAGTLSAEAVERIRAAAFRIWGGGAARPAAPAPDTPVAGQPIVVVVPEAFPSVPPASPDAGPRNPDTPAAARAPATDKTLFSAADAAVVPPSLLRPRLPMRSSAGVREENLPQVELLVSPTGEVESVKLLTEPAGVKSAMMLSAIKTWRFEPATSDGRPVRYRLILRLTNQ